MSIARLLAIAIIAAAISLAAHAGTFTTLYTFTGGDDGGQPSAQLVYQNGTLYGATYDGSPGNIFAIDTATGTLTVVYKFTGTTDGRGPNDLIYHGGKLYGTTFEGGKAGAGTVFVLNPKTGKHTILHSFAAQGNGLPADPGGLIYESGMLYGVEPLGGNTNNGMIFAFNLSTDTESTLFNFNGTDGFYPNSSLVLANGLLYGTTAEGGANSCQYGTPVGCGVVFGIDPITGAQTIIYSFNGTDGFLPWSNLIFQKGLLYGATLHGSDMSCGKYGCSTLYSVSIQTGAEDVLTTNTGTKGQDLTTNIVDHGASIYEVLPGTDRGSNFGELVKFDIKSGHKTVLHKFTNGSDGAFPDSALTYSGGVYYGTTTGGGDKNGGCGSFGCGTIFQYVP